MEFFRIKGDLPFMKYALYFNAISLITFLIAVGALFTKGLHYGIDFTGGTVAELRYAKPADMAQARAAIAGAIAAAAAAKSAVIRDGTDELFAMALVPPAYRSATSVAMCNTERSVVSSCPAGPGAGCRWRA